MQVRSLFTSFTFCNIIFSCSLISKERIYVAPFSCVSLVEIPAMINLYYCFMKCDSNNCFLKNFIIFFRGSLRSHVSLFVLLFWVCSVLLLTRTTPWPSLWPHSNSTNVTNQMSFDQTSFVENATLFDHQDDEALFEDRVTSSINETSFNKSTEAIWLPPIFGLDNIHLWPIQVNNTYVINTVGIQYQTPCSSEYS